MKSDYWFYCLPNLLRKRTKANKTIQQEARSIIHLLTVFVEDDGSRKSLNASFLSRAALRNVTCLCNNLIFVKRSQWNSLGIRSRFLELVLYDSRFFILWYERISSPSYTGIVHRNMYKNCFYISAPFGELTRLDRFRKLLDNTC